MKQLTSMYVASLAMLCSLPSGIFTLGDSVFEASRLLQIGRGFARPCIGWLSTRHRTAGGRDPGNDAAPNALARYARGTVPVPANKTRGHEQSARSCSTVGFGSACREPVIISSDSIINQ